MQRKPVDLADMYDLLIQASNHIEAVGDVLKDRRLEEAQDLISAVLYDIYAQCEDDNP